MPTLSVVTDPATPGSPTRRTLLRALGLAPFAAALPLGAQTVLAGPAAAATYTVVAGALASTATGRTHNWVLTYPSGHATTEHLPVAIVMHGTGGRASSMIGLGYPDRLQTLISAGKSQPYVLASIDADNGYYQRMGSRDYGKLVATEFLGFLAGRGLDTSRLALTGWSMGGWGALRLAERELHGKVKVIAAVSTPAYSSWKRVPSYERTDMTKGQFNANNFYHHPTLLAKPRIFLLCGKSDGFYPGNKAFAKVLDKAKGVRAPKTSFTKGSHSASYWTSVASRQLQYVGKYL
jgi:S-formylglutathione hydrolase FrmB